MAERLTPLTSRIDALKRQLYDALTNPNDYLSMVGGRAAESLYATQQLQKQAFGDPRNPFKVTNENALRQLTDALMSGPLGFAPAGMISPQVAQKVIPQTKVVDESGKPMVVYHGTNKDYENFSESTLGEKTGNPTSRMGFFFSGFPSEASRYASDWGKAGGNVRPVYLDIKNPKRLTYKEMNDISMAMFDESASLPVNAWKTKEGMEAIAASKKAGIKKANKMADDLREQLIKEGYDGAVVKIGGMDEYIAFYPSQIKSAISDPEMSNLLAP